MSANDSKSMKSTRKEAYASKDSMYESPQDKEYYVTPDGKKNPMRFAKLRKKTLANWKAKNVKVGL